MPNTTPIGTSDEIQYALGSCASSSTIDASFLITLPQLQQPLQGAKLRSPSSISRHSFAVYWASASQGMPPLKASSSDHAGTMMHLWLLDFGASFHITPHSSTLETYAPLS